MAIAGGEREARATPASGETPNSAAPVAPAKPTWARRVAGEGLAAQHEEIADRAGDHRDDAARREGADHEVIG